MLCILLKIDKTSKLASSIKFKLFASQTFGCQQINDTSVDLDSGNDSLLLEDFDEWSSVSGLLVDGFVEQDDSGDVGGESIVSAEQQVTVSATVFFSVLDSDVLKMMKNFTESCKLYIFYSFYLETFAASSS